MIKTDRITTPVDQNVVGCKIKESKLPSVGKASIREILALINSIEKETGVKYIRMEMGIPGLKACNIGIEAEIAALKTGIANTYPNIEGVPLFKREISRFISLFLDINVPENCCIPCTGSTNGSFISFITISRIHENKNCTLFLDPGFPVHKQQLKVLGLPQKSLDVYDYRGDKLKNKLEEILSEGNVSSLLYSNPNNPAWICFTVKELKIIGELCTKYDVIVMEDLAYFNMDFRVDHSKPGEPPFQPTVAKYTDNYILLISSSKIFSYAGQRIGSVAVSEKLFKREYPDLLRYYTSSNFGHSLIYGTAYAVSAGITHSTQFALAAMLKAAND
ncbi:MAG TPA: pyridoxal phosphate-dependent aminotransferase, partial [Ignavibacteria bacterium]